MSIMKNLIAEQAGLDEVNQRVNNGKSYCRTSRIGRGEPTHYGGKVGLEFDGTNLIGNIKHLMNAENSLPKWKMIEKYTNAATKLLGHIKERSLDGYCKRDMLMKLAMTCMMSFKHYLFECGSE